MMYHQIVLSALVVLSIGTAAEKDKRKLLCAEMFCGVGRECVDDFEEPKCECVESCNVPTSVVCGSDGETYQSECDLHKTACRNDKQIEIVSNTSCTVESQAISDALNIINEQRHVPSPVVCLEKDRDSIRGGLISFLSKEVDGEGATKRSYKSLLEDYFSLLDEDKDGALDSMELMKLLEKNESISEVISMDTQTSNPILRGLCVDALISVTDRNSDYKLGLSEFRECLNPLFTPPKTRCELEGHRFEDGQVVTVDCNSCTCACGNWVCTTLECGGENIDTKEDSPLDNLYLDIESA